MKNTPFGILAALSVFVVLILGFPISPGVQAHPPAQADPPLIPVVLDPVQFDLSPTLGELRALVQPQGVEAGEPPPLQPLPKYEDALIRGSLEPDPALQAVFSSPRMPALGFNFAGIENINGVLPPDTNGDVGPNHYVQWVNLSMAVWQLNRTLHTASLVYGPAPGNAIWTGFGGPCEIKNQGDPIALYDSLADRWLISQFALPNFPAGPYYQCIAVSQTPNPAGAWYRYAYQISATKMNDYPHFGVWPDGYYMTVNQFTNNASQWGGAGAAVFERDKMLQGLSAQMVFFDLFATNPNFGGMLPSDLDGTPPPAGAPNIFAEADDSSWIGPQDALRLWEFHVNWTNPANSTFGNNGQPNLTLPVANFTPLLSFVPQPGTSVRLDNLADRIMHRLQYRNFGGYATLVTNHTVDAGSSRAGVRWYELRDQGSGWSIFQQGTYAGDGANVQQRWMGSAAMDHAGNIAVGYSRSSSADYPGIYYTGRLITDPLNTLPQGEAVLKAGNGSQTYPSGRWGDYSMLAVDPIDDCTFWYTNEYLSSTSIAGWKTQIGSFAFPSCFSELQGSLQGTVTGDGNPLEGALVEADAFSTLTGPDGAYSFPALPVGVYTVTATAYSYQPAAVQDIEVFYNDVTVQDFSLTSIPLVNVHGTVTDASGHGWPLYARLDISAPGFSRAVFTDPLTGAYSVDLVGGVAHTFQVSAVVGGYLSQAAQVTPGLPSTERNFALSVDTAHCTAPGYDAGGGCSALNGGLLVGHVYDTNTGAALNSAAVASDDLPAETADSFATPDDPGQDDGLYVLFSSLIGGHPFTASKASYGDDTHSATIVADSVTGRDFDLPAGRIGAGPSLIALRLDAGQTITATLFVTNTGTLSADFTVNEVDAPLQYPSPTGPFAQATRHTGMKRLADLDAQAVFVYDPPAVPALPAGQVLRSWASGLAHPWGIGYDARSEELWIGDTAAGGGDDRLHAFAPDGTARGAVVETAFIGAIYSAGLVFDPFSGKFWQAPVGGDPCLFEVDPVSQVVTPQRICPPFDYAQRGLAFDPLTRTFYSGAWTSGILYHFDRQGTILDSANLDLNISGLAFNPATRHLFVLSNAAAGLDVYVLDVEDHYAILGGFDIPGLGDYQQAGMSIDCSGHLWAVNQVTGEIFEADSGESGACAYADVPWLSVDPVQGSLLPGASAALELTFNADAAPDPRNWASLVITSDTPYGDLAIDVRLDVGNIYFFPVILK